jgi:hypothetical protein
MPEIIVLSFFPVVLNIKANLVSVTSFWQE